jgi:alkylation response protein AidB-like acyl-CoA dehydrogenase
MDFNYTEDQQAFADSARALFADACSDEALRAHDAGDEPFMQALWRQCIATGLHGIVIDEAHGGLGLGMTDLMAVLEQQGQALALVPLAEHQLAAQAVALFAPTLAPSVLAGAAGGETLLTLSLDGLRAARGLGLRLKRDGDALRLDGLAAALPLAAQAQQLLLPALLDGQPRLVRIDPKATGIALTPGAASTIWRWPTCAPTACGWTPARCWATRRWPGSSRAGWPRSLRCNWACRGPARAHGEYVSQRKQLGRVIGSFQLVAGQMADGKIAEEALRSALSHWSTGSTPPQRLPQALAVKVLAAQAAHLVGHKAQHVHGGMGVTSPTGSTATRTGAARWVQRRRCRAELARLGDWIAEHDELGWKYDRPEDHGPAATTGAAHALR